MGYSAGEGGSNPSFDFFGRRDQQETQPAIMEKRKKDNMATDSPFEVGGDSQQESPLLAALRGAPQRSLRGGGGGRADYGDPRRGQGVGGDHPRYDPNKEYLPSGGGYGRFGPGLGSEAWSGENRRGNVQPYDAGRPITDQDRANGWGRQPPMYHTMGGGGYGRNSSGGQQQFYGPRQGQGLALGSGGTGYNPNAPNPNATRGGYSV